MKGIRRVQPSQGRLSLPKSEAGNWLWRVVSQGALAVVAAYLVTNVVLTPTKRNLEVLAGLIFLGMALVAHPFKALLFSVVLIPFPAHTTVGSTTSLLILAVGGLTLVKSKQLQLPSPFFMRSADLALMGWGLMVLLSLYNANMAYWTQIQGTLVGFGSAVVLYYLVLQLVTSERLIITVLQVSQGVAAVLAAIALLQWVFPGKAILPEFFKFSRTVAALEDVTAGQVRTFATFPGYELFAEYMALSIVFHWYLLRRTANLFAKTWYVISLLLITFALFSTGTRGGMITLAVGLLYFLVAGGRAVPRGQVLKVLFVAIALFYLSLAFIQPIVNLMFERLADIGIDDGSVRGRTVILTEAFKGILDQPFLGHGLFITPGSFEGWRGTHIHNLYVTFAYLIGIPGLLAFLWFLFSLFKVGLRDSQDKRLTPSLREITFFLHAALLMFMVDQLKIECTRSALTMQLAFLHFGLIMAAHRLARQQRAALRPQPVP